MTFHTPSEQFIQAHATDRWFAFMVIIHECDNDLFTPHDISKEYANLYDIVIGAVDGILVRMGLAECLVFAPFSSLADFECLNDLLEDDYNYGLTFVTVEIEEYLRHLSVLERANVNNEYTELWRLFDTKVKEIENTLHRLRGTEPTTDSVDVILDALLDENRALRPCDFSRLNLLKPARKAG